MDPSVSDYLDALGLAARRVLGDALLGVHPHGSLMLGGWRRESSDIDVLVVVGRSLTAAEKAELSTAWRRISCPGVGLELSVVLDSVVASPTARSPFELHVTTAPDDKDVDGEAHPGDFDLVLHFAVCHALGIPGFPEVPRLLVHAQLVNELEWAAEHNPSSYAVLNACRAWRYTVDGSLVSKVDGGQWALPHLTGGERQLVRAALAIQTGQSETALDPEEVCALVSRLRDVIRNEP
jgi:predicted nucleotidyltransferase